MNKQYQDLFQMVAKNGALTSEQAMAALKNKEDNAHEMEILIDMRDKFNKLEDKILQGETLELVDYIQLYAGAMVSRNAVQRNINKWTAVVKEYDENLLPKLKEISNEMNADKRNALIEELIN